VGPNVPGNGENHPVAMDVQNVGSFKLLAETRNNHAAYQPIPAILSAGPVIDRARGESHSRRS